VAAAGRLPPADIPVRNVYYSLRHAAPCWRGSPHRCWAAAHHAPPAFNREKGAVRRARIAPRRYRRLDLARHTGDTVAGPRVSVSRFGEMDAGCIPRRARHAAVAALEAHETVAYRLHAHRPGCNPRATPRARRLRHRATRLHHRSSTSERPLAARVEATAQRSSPAVVNGRVPSHLRAVSRKVQAQ
jgi:hypothetical protein